MFQFPAFASYPYIFRAGYLKRGGFPHSEILGSKLVRSSPRLIAAYHVFHRLYAPRHSPNALKTLDLSHYQYSFDCSNKHQMTDVHSFSAYIPIQAQRNARTALTLKRHIVNLLRGYHKSNMPKKHVYAPNRLRWMPCFRPASRDKTKSARSGNG